MTGALLLGLAALAAAPDVRGGPVRVDAEEVHYAFQKREVTFSGRQPVTMTRDDAKLTCQKLVAKNDEAGQIVTAVCQGSVKLVRGERTVTCDRAIYENAGPRIICEGNTVLKDAGSEAQGQRLVYDLRTDEVNLQGRDGAPVMILLPGAQVDAIQQKKVERKERPK
jgi:lipopolysaccharide export system protein LptA